LLPRDIPRQKGWHVAVHYSAGLWPGGDYYDVLTLPDNRQFFLIGDASDQGAPATALALMARVAVHSCPVRFGVRGTLFQPIPAPINQPPHVLLGYLSHVLGENMLENQFMTAICGVLDPASGEFEFANAGHPYPRWWRAASGEVEALRDLAGPPLGTDYHDSYDPQTIAMEPGDMLVLYSDSLTVVVNGGCRISVQELVDDALRDSAPEGAEAVKRTVLARLDKFLAGEPCSDEITFLIIERQRTADSPAHRLRA
jgi:sigma-B regulation protein RsbU (phosphoserine phosphatase)